MKPAWVWFSSTFGARSPEGFSAREERLWFLKKVWALPWVWLVPDLVTTLTKPDEERPNSALAPSATTTTSLTASRLKVKAGRWPPRCSPKKGLLKSAPSTETLLWIPFWPLIDSSSPSGPCTVVTPGVSLVKSRKLRPLLGRLSTDLSSMRTAPSARVVSMTGASPVTVISPAAATWSGIFRLIVCPTPRSIPSRITLANPWASAVMR